MDMANKTNGVYEVLSPWAEAEPIAFRGISPRAEFLDGKKIGLYRNTKRAAEPTLKVVEEQLRRKYPLATFSWFFNMAPNEEIVEQTRKVEFEDWLKGVDVVIAAYGD
jgi:hypothetical protein